MSEKDDLLFAEACAMMRTAVDRVRVKRWVGLRRSGLRTDDLPPIKARLVLTERERRILMSHIDESFWLRVRDQIEHEILESA